jgi:hypothetical protein
MLAALPAILLMVLMNGFITSAVSGVVMIEMAAAGHKYLGLGSAILTAVVVYSWLVYNHKLREYIKSLESSK